MKIKTISRNPDDYIRETKRDIHKVQRNYDPALHPFEISREYTRALNATKLERVFAKPFIGSLDGHTEGINCMLKHPSSLSTVLTGSYNGEMKIWHLPTRKCLQTANAHEGYVRGMCYHPSGEYFFSCGDDQVIRQWKSPLFSETGFEAEPVNSIISKSQMYSIDHHWKENIFVTCGENTHIWQEERSEPIRTFKWGVDSVQSVKFNPIENHLLGACASDRSIMLYDMRGSQPLRKVVLTLKANTISWNPMEAYHFVCASEDYNAYTFDIRNLEKPVTLHRGHVAAVLDVDYSPTGKEFVTGSFDRTIRIFDQEDSNSREVYHTKRMQIVHCVRWSLDNRYILSGSDETNVRVWKANPSEKLGSVHPRMQSALNYNEKLKEKFAEFPQIKRIASHRHVPKKIFNSQKELMIIRSSKRRKLKNRLKNEKPGTVEVKTPLKSVVLREDE